MRTEAMPARCGRCPIGVGRSLAFFLFAYAGGLVVLDVWKKWPFKRRGGWDEMGEGVRHWRGGWGLFV